MTPNFSVKWFLLDCRRFISRCGIPENIISDNFNTFQAVEVHDFMHHLRIKWDFISEKSPWWGGFMRGWYVQLEHYEESGWRKFIRL